MTPEQLFMRLSEIIKEIQRVDQEHPTGPDEESDPRIKELIAEGIKVQQQLDPMMREIYRDNPAKLAEWDEIMHMCDDLDEKGHAKQELPAENNEE